MSRAATRLQPKQRTISRLGVAFIARWEGFVDHAYRPVPTEEYLTIGYGHYGSDVKPGQRITPAGAKLLLKQDAASAEHAVRNLVKVKLNRNEFDALVSLAFNIGVGAFASSTVLRELNKGHRGRAGLWFLVWNRDGQRRVLLGLSRRRHAERRLFRRIPA